MIPDVENLLAETLHSTAQDAPAPGDLLARVRERSRQRARRRTAAGGGMLVVAVLGSAGAVALRPSGQDAIVRRPDPPAAGSETASPFEPGSLPALQFPLTPRWLPEAVTNSRRISLGETGFEASFEDHARPGHLGVAVRVSDRDVSPRGPEASRRSTTVNGKAGELVLFADTLSLVWQDAPGEWRMVMAGGEWGAEDTVRRVAESLTEQPLDVRLPFEFTLMPRDSVPAGWSTDGSVTLVPRDSHEAWRTQEREVPGVVHVVARRARAELTGRGEEVTVRGHRGWLLRQDGGRHTLVLVLGAEIALVIDTPPWAREQVLEFAEATRYTGGLPRAEG